MSKQKPQEKVIIEYTDWTQFLPWLTQFAFVLAIGLVIARMLMLEMLHDPFSSLENSTVAPRPSGLLDRSCLI